MCAQATDTKPGTIAYGLPEIAFGDRMGGLSNLSREELEQRARALLGTSQQLGQGTPPNTVTGTFRYCDNSLRYAAGPHDCDQQQGEHPAWDCPLAAEDGEVGFARDERNIGAGLSPNDGDDCRSWVPELESGAFLDHEEGEESSKIRLDSDYALDMPLFVAEPGGEVLAKGRRTTATIQQNYGATLVSDAPAANVSVSDDEHIISLAFASSVQPRRAAPSGLSLSREPKIFDGIATKGTAGGLESKRSAIPLETRWAQRGSSIASFAEFAEDPVVAALLQRVNQIEEELKEHRSLRP